MSDQLELSLILEWENLEGTEAKTVDAEINWF